MKIFKWICARAIEPSTWAAGAILCVAVAFLVDNFWIAVAGMIVAGGAVFLRERGVI